MLRSILHNRKIFISGLLLTILGAWMPLVCRDCLAHSAPNTDFQQQIPVDHCNQDKGHGDTTTDYAVMHSSGVCDCGDMDVLVSTKQKSTAHNLKNSLEKPSFNYFTSNEPAPIILTGSVIKQLKPDRACLHPHKKYCIQLK